MIGLRKSGYWILVSALMILLFFMTGTPLIQTIYFISFLMPVIIITSYYFNHHLIPNYLIPGKYSFFIRYAIYTIIFALYAQAVVLFLSLLLFSNYQTEQLNSLDINVLSLALGTLLIIIAHAFYQSIITLNHQKKTIDELTQELTKTEVSSITIKSNRQNVQILLDQLILVESKGDYVQMHTTSETLITKEKISSLEEKLPSQFIRTHRSFIINKEKISSFNKVSITIDDKDIPISRTYKKEVLKRLAIHK